MEKSLVAISYNQPDSDYRREPAEAQSYVKHILKSPQHYLAAKEKQWPPTPNMQIGSAVHCLVLEGLDAFNDRYILKPDDMSFSTKEGKAWKAQNSRKTILTNSDRDKMYDSILGMSEKLMSLDFFRPEQTDYQKYNELSIYWRSAEQLECKARLDRLWVQDDKVIVLDLKTTDSVDPKKFERKVHDLNYLFQAGWYTEAAMAAYGLPVEFWFVAVERQSPHSIGIFPVAEDMMAEALSQTQHARKVLSECKEMQRWRDPETFVFDLTLPSWYVSPVPVDCYGDEELF